MGIPRRIGSFRPFAEIAHGEATRVFKAHDPESGRVVVVKLLRRESLDDELDGLAQRFRAEAIALRSVSHPNVVEIIDVGESDDGFFIVTDFVEGESLDALIADRTIPGAIGAFIVREVVAGLVAVHAAGILHRDVKPANIVVGEAGTVHLIDFGLAQSASTSQAVAGTVGYLAPELLTGSEASVRSDLYSVGVTLAEVLTGRKPTIEPANPRVLDRTSLPRHAVSGDGDFLAAAAVDPEFAACVRLLTRRVPAERPADGNTVLNALDEALAGYRPVVDQRMLAAWLADKRITLPRRMVAVEASVPPKHAVSRQRSFAVLGVLVTVLFIVFWTGLRKGLVIDDSAGMLAETPADTLARTPADQLAEQSVAQSAAQSTAQSTAQSPDQPTDQPTDQPADQSEASSAERASSDRADSTDAPAYITISVLPWARVFVDDVDLGVTPISAPFQTTRGRHDIRLENPEFPNHSFSLTATPGDTSLVQISLWSTVARLELAVTPWAEVLIDGVVRDTIPPMGTPLIVEPGEARLTLQHPSLGSFDTTLDVRADSTYRLSYNLYQLAKR